MVDLVDASIQQLRKIVGVQSDAELARQLELDKSSLTAWRSRGRVPEKYQAFLDQVSRGEPIRELEVWPELQRAAQRIALARFTLLRCTVASSGMVDQAMPIFLSLRPFWFIMYRAAVDVRKKMLALGVALETAQALVLQDDLRMPSETTSRIERELSEDLRDNPDLLKGE